MPRGPDQSRRFAGYDSDALLALGIGHQLPVIGADDRGIERALELLRVLLVAQLAPGKIELILPDEPGLARLEHQRIPVLRVGACARPSVEQRVPSLWRADEHRPALAIGQRRGG